MVIRYTSKYSLVKTVADWLCAKVFLGSFIAYGLHQKEGRIGVGDRSAALLPF